MRTTEPLWSASALIPVNLAVYTLCHGGFESTTDDFPVDLVDLREFVLAKDALGKDSLDVFRASFLMLVVRLTPLLTTLGAGDTSELLSLRLEYVLRLFLRVPQPWALPVHPLWISLLIGRSSGANGDADRRDCSNDLWLLTTAIISLFRSNSLNHLILVTLVELSLINSIDLLILPWLAGKLHKPAATVTRLLLLLLRYKIMLWAFNHMCVTLDQPTTNNVNLWYRNAPLSRPQSVSDCHLQYWHYRTLQEISRLPLFRTLLLFGQLHNITPGPDVY